jgi:hypothetical protein
MKKYEKMTQQEIKEIILKEQKIKENDIEFTSSEYNALDGSSGAFIKFEKDETLMNGEVVKDIPMMAQDIYEELKPDWKNFHSFKREDILLKKYHKKINYSENGLNIIERRGGIKNLSINEKEAPMAHEVMLRTLRAIGLENAYQAFHNCGAGIMMPAHERTERKIEAQLNDPEKNSLFALQWVFCEGAPSCSTCVLKNIDREFKELNQKDHFLSGQSLNDCTARRGKMRNLFYHADAEKRFLTDADRKEILAVGEAVENLSA